MRGSHVSMYNQVQHKPHAAAAPKSLLHWLLSCCMNSRHNRQTGAKQKLDYSYGNCKILCFLSRRVLMLYQGHLVVYTGHNHVMRVRPSPGCAYCNMCICTLRAHGQRRFSTSQLLLACLEHKSKKQLMNTDHLLALPGETARSCSRTVRIHPSAIQEGRIISSSSSNWAVGCQVRAARGSCFAVMSFGGLVLPPPVLPLLLLLHATKGLRLMLHV